MDAQETSIYHAFMIASLVIGTIIIFFVISLARHQRRNLELHRQNIMGEIAALEKERARIASDIHDEIGPVLSAVKMKINSFELIEEDDKLQMAKTNEHIDEMLKRIRGISFDLMPNSLLRKGLVSAIKEFITYLNSNTSTQFHFASSGNFEVEEQKAINIYRIVQETAHNAVKHAQATDFWIDINGTKKTFFMTIADNGKGFDQSKESKNTVGFGLRGLLSRTEIAGGKMYLESIVGKGTKFNFEFPI